MKTAMDYLEEIYQATNANKANLLNYYEGKEGALRLAREIGYGLNDFPEKEQHNAITSSYGKICVRFYNLRPPVNSKEWNMAMLKALDSMKTKKPA